jgi:hypothetical protein
MVHSKPGVKEGAQDERDTYMRFLSFAFSSLIMDISQPQCTSVVYLRVGEKKDTPYAASRIPSS